MSKENYNSLFKIIKKWKKSLGKNKGIQQKTNELWQSCFADYTKRKGFDTVKYKKIIDKYIYKTRDNTKKTNIVDLFRNNNENNNNNDEDEAATRSNTKRKFDDMTESDDECISHDRKKRKVEEKKVNDDMMQIDNDNDKNITLETNELDKFKALLTPDNANCIKQIQIIDEYNKNMVELRYYQEQQHKNIPINIFVSNKIEINKIKKKNDEIIKKLKKLKGGRLRSKKSRENDRNFKFQAKEELGDKAKWYNMKNLPGKPRYVETQKGENYLTVLEAIVDAHCTADPTRRTETRVKYTFYFIYSFRYFFLLIKNDNDKKDIFRSWY